MRYCKKVYFSFFLLICLYFAFTARLSAEERYWEYPAQFTSVDSRFPSVLSGSVNGEDFAILFYEEVEEKRSELYLSAKITNDGSTWRDIRRFAGPYSYVGSVPDQYAAAVNDSGTVCVAVITGIGTLSVFSADISSGGDISFSENALPAIENPLLAPRIYKNSEGGFTLFSSQGQENSFSMMLSFSADGKVWSAFETFAPAQKTMNPFLPVLFPWSENVDKVIFQAQYNNGSRLVYQLYKTEYDAESGEWTEASLITNENSFIYEKDSSRYDSYNNQRPTVLNYGGKTYIAWERSYSSSDQSHIWFSEYDGENFVRETIQELTASGSAHRPILFETSENLSIVWFDNRRGFDSVFFGEFVNGELDGSVISRTNTASSFAYPVNMRNQNYLSFVWQQDAKEKGKSNVFILEKDHSVPTPKIKAVSFAVGKRSTAKRVTAQIVPPDDSSGIMGYSWIFTQDKDAEVPAVRTQKTKDTAIRGNATADGLWYFKVRCEDYAGNWSDAATIAYYRDTTPPLKPLISEPKKDGDGFVISNTFSIGWRQNPRDIDVAGYTWM